MRSYFLLIVAYGFISGAHAQQEMQPGQWEMTSTMKMQGMQMPGHKWSHCFTAKDLADGKQHSMDDGRSKCQMADLKISGSAYSYKFSCTSPDGKMSGQAAGNGTQNGFKTELKLKMIPDQGVGELSQVVTGQRTGACK